MRMWCGGFARRSRSGRHGGRGGMGRPWRRFLAAGCRGNKEFCMLRITGGKVYDPAHNVNGVVKDICIGDDGRIVENVAGGRTIDATGMIVFPGGVDIHTHVAGAALNFARAMTPENQRAAAKFVHTPERRMGIGGPTPTTYAT